MKKIDVLTYVIVIRDITRKGGRYASEGDSGSVIKMSNGWAEVEMDTGGYKTFRVTSLCREDTLLVWLSELKQTCNVDFPQWEGKTDAGQDFYAQFHANTVQVCLDGETVLKGDTEDGPKECSFEQIREWAADWGFHIYGVGDGAGAQL